VPLRCKILLLVFLAFVTGFVNQQLLLKNEYLLADNRILKARLKPGFQRSVQSVLRSPGIGKRIGQIRSTRHRPFVTVPPVLGALDSPKVVISLPWIALSLVTELVTLSVDFPTRSWCRLAIMLASVSSPSSRESSCRTAIGSE
jgi:hypothetical protein